MPIILDISEDEKRQIKNNNSKKILLVDENQKELAILKNIEIYTYSKQDYSKYVF
jgi:ATP sulfurylase